MTCKELIDYIMKEYNVEVSTITSGNFTLFQSYSKTAKARMTKKIEEIYNEQSKGKLNDNIKYLYLEISGDVGEAMALMPLFKYVFK